MVTLTKAQLKNLEPCNIEERVARFGKARKLNAEQAFEAGFIIRDLCWVAGKLNQKEKLVLFANKCAESVSHLKNASNDATAATAATANADDAAADANATATAANATAAAAYAAATAANANAAAAYATAADDAAYAAAKQKHIKLCQSFFIEIFDSED